MYPSSRGYGSYRMTHGVRIAYTAAFALLALAIAFSIMGSRSIFHPCWIEHPIYVPIENPALCQRQLTLWRVEFAAACGFVIASVAAVTLHIRARRKSRRIN